MVSVPTGQRASVGVLRLQTVVSVTWWGLSEAFPADAKI